MASTNKTANLGLNQWVTSDAVRMADFNEDNRRIDEAMGKRLELVLLREFNLAPVEAAQIDMDLSDIKFEDYMFVAMDVISMSTCHMYFNNEIGSTNMGQVDTRCRFFFFPLRNGNSVAYYIKFNVTLTTGGGGSYFNKLNMINFVRVADTCFPINTSIKLWGVK